MTKRRANYCPDCGAELDARVVDGRERPFCPECEAVVFQTPTPTGQVVVVDDSEVLLVERDHGRDEGRWIVPGGFIEVDEPARVGAARELEEETGLAVDPDALALVRTGFDMPGDPAGGSVVSICFAVERDATHGLVSVGDEPATAAFRDPEDFGVDETRSVDRPRIAAAFDRLDGSGRQWETKTRLPPEFALDDGVGVDRQSRRRDAAGLDALGVTDVPARAVRAGLDHRREDVVGRRPVRWRRPHDYPALEPVQ